MAPAAGRTLKMSGAAYPAPAKDRSTAARTSRSAPAGMRAIAEPPKPPPVIRAPSAPAERAASTARSSSAQEISKSSRIEAWEASRSGPIAGGRRCREQFDRLQHAVVLGHDVADPAERLRVQEPAGLVEVGEPHLAQGRHAEDLGAQLAGLAPGGVAAAGVGMRNLRVDHQQLQPGRPGVERHQSTPGPGSRGRRRGRPAAQRGGLVHDARRGADEIVLGPLGGQNHVLDAQPGGGEVVQCGDDGAFDGMGGGQAGARGDVRGQQQVQAGDGEAALLQRPEDAQRIFGPARARWRGQGPGVRRRQSLVCRTVDSIRMVESGRSRTATRAVLSMANGSTKPSL